MSAPPTAAGDLRRIVVRHGPQPPPTAGEAGPAVALKREPAGAVGRSAPSGVGSDFVPARSEGKLAAASMREDGMFGGAVPRKRLVGIQFGLFTDEQIRAMSVVSVKHSSITDRVNKFGVNDSVMGAIDRSSRCVVCQSTVNDCPGHCGHIDLWVPIPAPDKIDVLRRVLDCVCMCCGQLLFPVTDKIRQELLALQPKKRLAAAAKRCQNVCFCGQIQQHAERMRRIAAEKAAAEKAAAEKAQADAQTALLAAAAAAAAEAEGDENEEEGEDAANNDDDDDDDDDENGDEDEEDDDDDGLAALNDGDEDVERGDGDAEADDDGGGEDDVEGGGDEGDEEGIGREGDGGEGKKRRRRKPPASKRPAKRQRAAAPTAPSATRSTVSPTVARAVASEGAAAAEKEKEKGGRVRSGGGRSRQLEGDYVRDKVRELGCGAPVAHYERDGLRLHAKYYLPYRGDPSKANWPTHNSWHIYEVLRTVSPLNQRLLGFHPRKSPMRALLLRSLLVPPPSVRRKKEDGSSGGGGGSGSGGGGGGGGGRGSGSGGSNQDDNTQALREVAMRSRKLVAKLREDGVLTQAQLGSVHRSVVWQLPASASQPFGSNTNAIAPNSGRDSGPAQLVPCVCDDPDTCTCIAHNTIATPATGHTRAAARDSGRESAASGRESGGGGGGRRGGPKGWRELLGDLETALTTYLIGEINKKGASRKDGKPGLSAWANTTGGANALVKRDRSFAARFVGKHGRIRGTMYGKRCDKTARSVASGDLFQCIDEIGVPREIAETLTVCETFRGYNRAKQMDRLRSNCVEYVSLENGDLYNTRFKNRDAWNPPMGSTFERHMETGDPVVYNRQPTLHKPSIEGARAKRVKHPLSARTRRTLAANQCLTVPLNLDFDGDEINLHLAIGPCARAETMTLMSAPQQIRSQQGDSVIICLVQNSRLALYLLTESSVRFRRHEFVQLLLQFGQVSEHADVQNLFERNLLDLPAPHRVDPDGTRWWSGLQVVSALLPPGIHYGRRAEADSKEKADVTEVERAYIVDSEMLSGRLTGRDVGAGESGNLLHTIVQDCGEEIACAWLSGFQRVLNYFLMQHGATMAPADYDMPDNSKHEAVDIVQKAARWVRVAATAAAPAASNAAAAAPAAPAPCTSNATAVPTPSAAAAGSGPRRVAAAMVVGGEERWRGLASGYDMRRPNDAAEKLIGRVLERSRELVASRLERDVELRARSAEQYGGRRNGVLDLIKSGAKGKPPHLMQMGAMAGQQMPLCGRVVANVAHFNRTRDTPEAHGYVPECYRDGLGPWSFFCAAIGGREGLVHTGSSTPQVGYFQKRLGTNMSDLHGKADGTIRDCRGHIVQWAYGDDAKDPAFLESNEARFFTPLDRASPALQQLQRSLLESRAKLYELSRYLPKAFLAPLNLARLVDRAASAPEPAADPADEGHYGDLIDITVHVYPALGRMLVHNPPATFISNEAKSSAAKGGVVLGEGEVEELVGAWFGLMEGLHLLRPAGDPRYNLLLDAMLRDVLSPWHVVQRRKMTLVQLLFVLNQLEIALARSGLVSGEAVGPIASQSMGEPATQSTLNLFHFAGSQNTMQSAIGRLNDTVNACKKPLAAGMTVFLRPPWNASRRTAETVAVDIPERRLMEFVLDIRPFASPDDWPADERPWLHQSLDIVEPPKARAWVAGQWNSFVDAQGKERREWSAPGPTVRVEFDVVRCRRSHLHLMEIAKAVRDHFKRGAATLGSGSFAPRWVLYVSLAPTSSQVTTITKPQQSAKQHATAAAAAAAAADDGAARAEPTTLAESAVVACLQETFVRGLARVSDALVVEIDTKHYSQDTHSIGTRREWCIVTQGSNLEGLLSLPAVDFERCATSYVHDVHKLLGVEGARRWLDENIEDLVRSCKSRVDVHHTKLIADVMTRTGTITPMTRNGLQNSTDSVVRLLFEDVLENIKRGGVHAQRDELRGVPESIMMGICAPIGTGATTILDQPPPPPARNHGAANKSDETGAEGEDLRVVGGVREIPCRPRPFRFFQQFVPVYRNGTLDPHLAAVVQPPVPALTNATAIATASAAKPTLPRIHIGHYAHRAPLWLSRQPQPAPPIQTLTRTPAQRTSTTIGCGEEVELEMVDGGTCSVTLAA